MTPSPLTQATAEVLAVGAALATPPKPNESSGGDSGRHDEL